MTVRCSLLGHDFGASEIEREREERGSEVVVTVTEYEACTRCRTRNVISENTEVRRLEGRSEVPTEPEDEPPSDAADSPDAESEPLEATMGEPIDASDAEVDPIPTDEHGDPITDDAEILDGSSTDGAGRERGAWPDSADVGQSPTDGSNQAEWPSVDSPDAGEAEILDGETGMEAEPAATATTSSGIERAAAAPNPGETAPRDDVPVEFFCPRCSFVAPQDRGSLRAGDICPECRKGYLGERER